MLCPRDNKHGALRRLPTEDGHGYVAHCFTCGFERELTTSPPPSTTKRACNRYPEELKILAVNYVKIGCQKNKVYLAVGCSGTALNDWIEKYGSKDIPEPSPEPEVTPPEVTPPTKTQRGTYTASLDLEEHERLTLLDECRRRGTKVVAAETNVNKSTFDRWARSLKKTGFTLKPPSTYIPILRDTLELETLKELRNTLTGDQYRINRLLEAVEIAIGLLESGELNKEENESDKITM